MRGPGVGLSITPCINCGPGAPRSTDGTLYEWYCGLSGAISGNPSGVGTGRSILPRGVVQLNMPPAEVQFTGTTAGGSDGSVPAEPKPVRSAVVCSTLSSGALPGAPAKRRTEPS